VKKILTLVLIFALSSVLIKSSVHAATYDVSGNGEGSQNSVNVSGSNTTSNQQNNTSNINNNINANANSGGNSASGNNGNSMIVTGDSSVTVKVTNNGNNNYTKDTCCKNGTPTPIPTKSPSQTPTPTGGPTSTPGGDGGSSGGSSGNSNGSSGSNGSSPQVLGLSNTSGNASVEYLFYAFGLACLGLAGKLFKSH
jgi:hypothetical protein